MKGKMKVDNYVFLKKVARPSVALQSGEGDIDFDCILQVIRSGSFSWVTVVLGEGMPNRV